MREFPVWRSPCLWFVTSLFILACGDPATTTPADVKPTDVDDTQDVPVDVGEETQDTQDTVDTPPPSEDVTDTADSTPPEEVDVPTTPQPCDPALAIEPSESAILPLDLRSLKASGGTGAYRFAMAIDPAPSGGLVNALTGAYLSGDVTGVTDEIIVTDLGCLGSATASVTIVPEMVVSPQWVELIPESTLTLSVTDGSGDVAFELTEIGSGGDVSNAGIYTAGTDDGMDVIQVIDLETGQVETTAVNVNKDATLDTIPSQLFIPLGAEMQLTVQGGSGHVSPSIIDDVVSYADGWFSANNLGTTTVQVSDDFTGMTSATVITVVETQQAPMIRHGDVKNAGVVIAPGDIDGDGFADAILGMTESDIGAVNGGAVYIYKGNATGLDTTPARIFSLTERRAELGRTIAAADILNDDGLVDLVIGGPRINHGGSDNGAIHIYEGIPNGLFSETPTVVRAGEYNSHLFGQSVAICDFNGDTRLDLAVASWYGEDRDASPVISDTGAIHIFLGYPDGILDEPDMTVYGVHPDAAGNLVPKKSLLLGRMLAAGDMDGDGKCELAVSNLGYVSGPDRQNDGIVAIYRGVGATNQGPGGIEPHPARFYSTFAANDTNSQLGRRLAMGDLTGDGKAELAIGQWAHDANKNNVGAAHVILGGDLGTGPATTIQPITDADWTLEGTKTNDYYGWDVLVEDINNDDRNDLLVGNWNGEIPGGPGDAGTVDVFYGVDDALPALTPDVTFGSLTGGGLVGGDRYGQSMAVLQNPATGDAEHLLGFANLADYLGTYVGQAFLSPVDQPNSLTALDMPGNPAGSRFGHSAAVVGDVNGDGWEDMVVGAPWLETVEKGTPNVGAVFLYLGDAEGFESQPSLQFAGFTGHSWSDEFGWKIAKAGDFNGDTIPDFAVLARGDDRPVSFGDAFAGATTCGAKVDNGGVLYIFLGSNSGLPSATPAFAFFADQKNIYIDQLDGGFDFNGDAKDDLVVGTYRWDESSNTKDVGWMGVVQGRAAIPNKISVICEADMTVRGIKASDNFGRSVTGIGDLNGDDCDEIAVGASHEDFGGSNAGSVRVFYGWGDNCMYQDGHASLFTSGSANALAGWALDGGEDVDGDNLPDLAVGGYNYIANGSAVGAAWVIPGSYLASKTPVALTNNQMSPQTPMNLFLDNSVTGVHQLKGNTAAGRFGEAVALIPNLSGGGRAGLAIGAPLASVFGKAQAGGVSVHRFNLDTGLEEIPMAAVGGETYRLEGRTGNWVSGGMLGGKSILTVGGYDGHGAGLEGLDQGALYVVEFPVNAQ